jgi:ankyrin repeat protein
LLVFLIACEDGTNADVIRFLLDNHAEINRCNILGYNAVMLVIRNEDMDIDTKLEVIQMLIDRGIDINWVNCYAETALNIAISRIEPRIAKLLMDNGCVLTIPEPTKE